MNVTGENRSTRGRNCLSATLSSTNPIWTIPRSNPGLRGETPATNRPSRGTAYAVKILSRFLQPICCHFVGAVLHNNLYINNQY
jgi:hypothetical protein